MLEIIDNFREEYLFLSNFYIQEISFTCYDNILKEPVEFYNVEKFFQWSKAIDVVGRTKIANSTKPRDAKKFGRKCKMHPEWNNISPNIMAYGEILKYSVDDNLAVKLLNTDKAYLVEGNTWHDNLWGDCRCNKCKNITGQNLLGLALMKTRDILKDKFNGKLGKPDMMYYIDTGIACGGIIVKDGKIVDGANIFKWMFGKSFEKTIGYLKRKGQLKQFRPVN